MLARGFLRLIHNCESMRSLEYNLEDSLPLLGFSLPLLCSRLFSLRDSYNFFRNHHKKVTRQGNKVGNIIMRGSGLGYPSDPENGFGCL
jgi:hypothetical protein